MKADDKKRILFFINDFKTDCWGAELEKYNYEVIPKEKGFLSHLEIIVNGYLRNQRIHAFIFRYLNDHESIIESSLYLVRDILIIGLCKIFSIKILWILHNIDKETKENYPSLIQCRRTVIHLASHKVLVTDLALTEVAKNQGIDEKKVEWICFGKPILKPADQKNIGLKKQIIDFKVKLKKNGAEKIYLGLCVSRPAKKKLHYLLADSIVGIAGASKKSIIALVLIGRFPEGTEFKQAKQRIKKSPNILCVEDLFDVNEAYISDQIDFFYRSLDDQSVPYTLYISVDLKKPLVTHNRGALPLLIDREKLGLILNKKEKDIQNRIADHIEEWSPEGAEHFLKNRSWKKAAEKFVQLLED